jgi:hypothetical protein
MYTPDEANQSIAPAATPLTFPITEPNMIKKIALGVSFVFATMPHVAATELPKDVEKFIVKRESCDHFRGEVSSPGDKQRVRQLQLAVQKWCTGTDRYLAQLKKKYANDESITHRLAEFEANIEPARRPH